MQRREFRPHELKYAGLIGKCVTVIVLYNRQKSNYICYKNYAILLSLFVIKSKLPIYIAKFRWGIREDTTRCE